MKIFEYKNFNLSLNLPEILLIPEFKAVLDFDKSKDKEQSFKIFTYGYLLIDWNSPFREYSDEDRKREALLSAELTEKNVENEMVSSFINKYNEIINSNRIIRYIKSTWESIDKLEEYCKKVDLLETVESGARRGSLVHNVNDYRNTIMKMPDLIKTAKELRDQLKEEMGGDEEAARGNVDKGYF